MITKLRESHPDNDFTPAELEAAFWIMYPDASRELYSGLLKDIKDAEVSPEVGDTIVKAAKHRQCALKLAEQAYLLTQGKSSVEELQGLINELVSSDDRPSGYDGETTDLDSIINSAYKDGGLRWRLNFLNKSLGPVRPGDFGFLFKRPESGGTAFAASEVGYWIDQVDKPIVWINNEESNDKVILRVYQSYFGVPVGQLIGNLEGFRTRWRDEVGKKFLFFGLERSNRRDIEGIVRQYSPSVVVYDQLDKVSGFDADREDLKLGAIYQWARELAKKGHVALGITQADGSAEGIKWLSMANVSSAKTSKQAEADFILGMGRVNTDGMENIRYINVCKNKLLGDNDIIATMRHGRAEVLIDAPIMRFKDIIDYD